MSVAWIELAHDNVLINMTDCYCSSSSSSSTSSSSSSTSIVQAVFAIDGLNYHAHVFAGLAALELGKRAAAKEHYRTAITVNTEDPFAWKVCG